MTSSSPSSRRLLRLVATGPYEVLNEEIDRLMRPSPPGNDAKPLALPAVKAARRILNALEGLEIMAPKLTRTPEAGAELEWLSDRGQVNLLIKGDGRISLSFFDPPLAVEPAPFTEATAVRELQRLWNGGLMADRPVHPSLPSPTQLDEAYLGARARLSHLSKLRPPAYDPETDEMEEWTGESAPTQQCLAEAWALLDVLQRAYVPRPDVLPSADRGVDLRWKSGLYQTELQIRPGDAPIHLVETGPNGSVEFDAASYTGSRERALANWVVDRWTLGRLSSWTSDVLLPAQATVESAEDPRALNTFEDRHDRVDLLAHQKPGWFADGSEQISNDAVGYAHYLLDELERIDGTPPLISPTFDGGLELAWTANGNTAVEITPIGEFVLSHISTDGEPPINAATNIPEHALAFLYRLVPLATDLNRFGQQSNTEMTQHPANVSDRAETLDL